MTVRQRTEQRLELVQSAGMTLDQTFTRNVPKPWGSTDLRPWNAHHVESDPIGEVWFQRSEAEALPSALLLKLLFTTSALSIQVHPDDAFAQSIGLAHGKSEAWYILSALPHAKVALGLKRRVGAPELRASIDAGTIADLIQWRSVKSGDLVYVPAGTVHAIGPGLVLVEIQQRSEATFRLFDFGRQRELQVDNAVAAARGEQAARQVPLRKLTKERTLLVASPSFVVERVELPPGSDWELAAATETWLFVLKGGAWVGILDARVNEAVFLEADSARVRVRAEGLSGLLTYVGSDPIPGLLRSLEGHCAGLPNTQRDVHPVTQPRA
jgi:mannose-6-phosphate isomerase